MTVSTTGSRKTFSGNGSTTEFAFDFKILAETDLVVKETTAGGVETTKVLTTDYTVNSGPWPTGGTVTMGTAPASGVTLSIERSVPLTQATDYTENDDFPAETHETALDKATLLVQQVNEKQGRSLIFPAADDASIENELPIASARASQLLAFDANGAPTVGTYANTVHVNNSNGNPNISDTPYDIGALSINTWHSVTTAEWAALSSVAAAANWIRIRVLTQITVSGIGGLALYARNKGSTESVADVNKIYSHTEFSGVHNDLKELVIPITDREFSIYMTETVTSHTCVAYLVGYGFN